MSATGSHLTTPPAESEAAKVLRLLANARALLRARLALRVAVVAAATALVTLAFAGSRGSVGIVMVSALIAAALVLTVTILLGWPTLPRIARAIDQRWQFNDRVATASELLAGTLRPAPQRRLAAALLADTARRISADRSSRAPLRWERPDRTDAILAALLALAAAFAVIVATSGDAAPAASAGAAAEVDPGAAAEVAELARLVAADAAANGGEPLAALAEDFAALDAALRAGMTREELAGRLTELAGRAAAAYAGGAADAAPPGAVEQRLAALQAGMDAAGPAADAGATAPNLPEAGDAPLPGIPDAGAAGAMAGDTPQRPTDLPEGGATTGANNLVIDPDALAEAQWGEADPLLEQARRELQELLEAANFRAVAGAQNSTRGPGDAAGQGAQALGGAETADAGAFERRDDIMLPAADPVTAATVRIEAIPNTVPTATTGPAGDRAWQRSLDAPVRRTLLTGERDDAIARYFTAPAPGPAP